MVYVYISNVIEFILYFKFFFFYGRRDSVSCRMIQQHIGERKDLSKIYDVEKIAILMKYETTASLYNTRLLGGLGVYTPTYIRRRWQMVRACQKTDICSGFVIYINIILKHYVSWDILV